MTTTTLLPRPELSLSYFTSPTSSTDVLEKYKGLLISIRPALTTEYGVISKAKAMGLDLTNLFPVRILVALLKKWSDEKLDWLPLYNEQAIAHKHRNSFYFEDIFPVDYKSIILNGTQYESINDLHNAIEQNKQRRVNTLQAAPFDKNYGHDVITKCTTLTGVGLKADSKLGHSRLIINGEGPLFLRHRKNGNPYTLKRGGELLWHLSSTTISPTTNI